MTEEIFMKLYGNFMDGTAREQRRSQQQRIDARRCAHVCGVANPAGRLVMPVFVVVNHDLYQEHHDAASNGQRQSSGEIISEF